MLSGHTGFFQCATPHTTHHHTTQNNTQQHTETETDRDRQRQRKKTEKEDRDRERREDGRGETRQERRQCGGAWPFLVGGVNRLVNFVDNRDPCLLYVIFTDFIFQSANSE